MKIKISKEKRFGSIYRYRGDVEVIVKDLKRGIYIVELEWVGYVGTCCRNIGFDFGLLSWRRFFGRDEN